MSRAIEVKVGALILVALGLLAAFVIVMGGVSFERTYTVYVQFENPGGLQSGAPIRIAGVKVGKVREIEFRGGKVDPKTREPEPAIRAVAEIETRYQSAIYDDSRWFVTTYGVLGELFLAIDPGTPGRPVLQDGAVVHGISPPRLDLLLAESYELLHAAYLGISKNREQISETFDGLHKTLKASGEILDKNAPKVDRIFDNVETMTGEANDTLKAARERYVDGPQVTRIMNDVERTTSSLNQNLPPLIADGREVLSRAKKLGDALASDEQIERYKGITRDAAEVARNAKGISKDAQIMVQHVKDGRGTVGALVMDEAVYDDLQEMLRDLKHNPWKFFWKQ